MTSEILLQNWSLKLPFWYVERSGKHLDMLLLLGEVLDVVCITSQDGGVVAPLFIMAI